MEDENTILYKKHISNSIYGSSLEAWSRLIEIEKIKKQIEKINKILE